MSHRDRTEVLFPLYTGGEPRGFVVLRQGHTMYVAGSGNLSGLVLKGWNKDGRHIGIRGLHYLTVGNLVL